MNTQRTHKTAQRLAAATAVLALSGLGTATLTTSATHPAVRAPGQISTSTPSACGKCYNHNEEAGRDDA